MATKFRLLTSTQNQIVAADALFGVASVPVNAIINGSAGTDLATRSFVEGQIQGAQSKGFARVAVLGGSLSGLGFTYSSLVLTKTTNGSINTSGIQGVTNFAVNDTIMVVVTASGADQSKAGPYVISNTGSAGSPYTLTRASNFNESSDIAAGSFVLIAEGDSAARFARLTTAAPYTLDTTQLEFIVPALPTELTAGDALTRTGYDLDVNYDSVTIDVNGSDQLRVKPDSIGLAQLNTDWADQITIDYGGGGGMIRVAPNSIGLAQLNTDWVDAVTIDLGGPAGSARIVPNSVGLTQLGTDWVDNVTIELSGSLNSARVKPNSIGLDQLNTDWVDAVTIDLGGPAGSARIKPSSIGETQLSSGILDNLTLNFVGGILAVKDNALGKGQFTQLIDNMLPLDAVTGSLIPLDITGVGNISTSMAVFNVPVSSRARVDILVEAYLGSDLTKAYSSAGTAAFARAASGNAILLGIDMDPSMATSGVGAPTWDLVPLTNSSGDVRVVMYSTLAAALTGSVQVRRY